MIAVTARHTPPPIRKPWYREPWPWLLMSGPAIVVVAGIATAVIAYRGADGLVADDYYKQGLGVNRQIARDEAARTLGLAGELRLEPGKVVVSLRSAKALPARLSLRFAHHARASEDRIVHLALRPDGQYEAPLADLGPTRWTAIVETAEWRVSATVNPGSTRTAALSPGVN